MEINNDKIMKPSPTVLLSVFSFVAGFATSAGCDQLGPVDPNTPKSGNENTLTTYKMKIGSGTFTATLFDNPTAAAFKDMLPM